MCVLRKSELYVHKVEIFWGNLQFWQYSVALNCVACSEYMYFIPSYNYLLTYFCCNKFSSICTWLIHFIEERDTDYFDPTICNQTDKLGTIQLLRQQRGGWVVSENGNFCWHRWVGLKKHADGILEWSLSNFCQTIFNCLKLEKDGLISFGVIVEQTAVSWKNPTFIITWLIHI